MIIQRNDPVFWLVIPAALATALPASAQTFLTEAQALQAVFDDAVVHREVKTLAEADRGSLEQTSGLRFPEASYTFFVGERAGQVIGHALTMNEVGKSEPITFLVAMDPAGKVTDVVVMVFRESRGAEVREKRFVRQFRGKRVSDPIRINQDVINYTGATLSSKALARGVKRALLLFEHFYPGTSKRPSSHSGLIVRPAAPVALSSSGELGLYRETRYVMGTLCQIRLWAATPAAARRGFRAGFAELNRLDRVFSNYRADSELAGVNREAAAQAVHLSDEFWALCRYAVGAWRHSHGSFDITVGPLMKAWGLEEGAPRVPTNEELVEVRALVGSDKIDFNPRSKTIRFARPGMELDFGGLAKGYAAERVARVLKREGIRAAIVNLGGSSLYALAERTTLGKSASTPLPEWVIGVTSPLETTRAALLLLLRGGWALSTSGTYEKRFDSSGRIVSHLLDPRTALPVTRLCGATVLAPSGRRTEVFAKNLMFCFGYQRFPRPRKWRRLDWVFLDNPDGIHLARHQHFVHTELLVPVEGCQELLRCNCWPDASCSSTRVNQRTRKK